MPGRRIGPAGVRVHRSRTLTDADRTLADGIPATSVARTLLDLAGVVAERDLARALDRAERLRMFDLSEVLEVLARANGRRGAAALRRAIAAWEETHAKSELEDRFRELVLASDLPRPRFNALAEGETRSHEVDVYWPAHRLVVEFDGYDFHRTRQDFDRDAAKDADLELAGLDVMRLSWNQAIVNWTRTSLRLRRRLAT